MLSGSSFGRRLVITTFGESHGPGLGVVLDGLPPGLPVDLAAVQAELDRRRPGQSAMTTARREPDRVEVLSGLVDGRTSGTPLALLVRNQDADGAAYRDLEDVFRPGHADYAYAAKYGLREVRGGGRSSGRETVARVAAGAVARQVLATWGAMVRAWVSRVGAVAGTRADLAFIDQSPVRAADPGVAAAMEAAIAAARDAGDSLGGQIEILATGVPAGLGEPVFGKLDASLAAALMSIGGVKAVEVGDGCDLAGRRGSEVNDALGAGGFLSNHAGGILGGISSGQPLRLRITVKPTASIARPQATVDRAGRPRTIAIAGRHDPCLCPRIVPVAEAMVALALLDAWLLQRGQRPGGWPAPPPWAHQEG
jgi:chorismate synthase